MYCDSYDVTKVGACEGSEYLFFLCARFLIKWEVTLINKKIVPKNVLNSQCLHSKIHLALKKSITEFFKTTKMYKVSKCSDVMAFLPLNKF